MAARQVPERMHRGGEGHDSTDRRRHEDLAPHRHHRLDAWPRDDVDDVRPRVDGLRREPPGEDSALFPDAATMALPAAEFFTRWITHICAPTFVFLAGTSLALSIERNVMKGMNAWAIDKNILTRGAIIALMDPTLISFGSGWWTFSVLTAIGLSMMCMALLRRLPTWGLLPWGWAGSPSERSSPGWLWHPPGNPSVLAAFPVAPYATDALSIKYPLFPWLAVMVLGWVFGRHLVRVGAGTTRVSGGRPLDLRRGEPRHLRGRPLARRRLRQHVPAPYR